MGIIICAFPATGKTTAINMAEELGIKACDSDSEDHHWVDRSAPRAERVERPDWPGCYMDHLIKAAEEFDFVFCSTHQEVRDALVADGIPFVVVYPTANQKAEFLKRVIERTTGLHGEFGRNLLEKNWDNWLEGMQSQENCTQIVLEPGEYLSEALDRIRAAAEV